MIFIKQFCYVVVIFILEFNFSLGQDAKALFPDILNLATRSNITTNATCGLQGKEKFCKLVEHVKLFPGENRHCDVCDARSQDRRQRHPIWNAIDGSNRWWQSPSLTNGDQYNYITITLDLKQVYQVAYVIVKAANAPRPGNWVLEKSVDGENFTPWQYFGITRLDCLRKYGLPDTYGIPNYLTDDQVICTTRYSKINPLENGEIFVSLVNGRPGVNKPSSKLLEFTSARYVRLRFEKIRTLNADLMTLRHYFSTKYIDPSVTERYFYSIKDISIGGQCICYGHAVNCQPVANTDRLSCDCTHNTCGNNCEKCCPGYYQKQWQPGHLGEGCEKCNCHNHADDCVYNATVDARGLSLDIKGEYNGGGVCLNCKDYTTGINCEQCIDGYYRPSGIPHTSQYPCRQCRCRETLGSTDRCYTDDSRVQGGFQPGDCICKPGFGGRQCNDCAFGYYGYPYCKPCPCSPAGSVDPSRCDGNCLCKPNVEGLTCDQCKQGYYNLDRNNRDGCRKCFCFGISTICQSSDLRLMKISHLLGGMGGWTVTTLTTDGFTLFVQPNNQGWLEYLSYPASTQNSLDQTGSDVIYYWQATIKYLGNRLTSYGGTLEYILQYDLDTTVPFQRHIYDVNVIMQGSNITLASGKGYVRENNDHTERLTLTENNWSRMTDGGRYVDLQPVSKRDFMTVLYNVERLLIRATYHSGQKTMYLKSVTLDTVSASSPSNLTLPTVEKCNCPRGYHGLSCESCEPGYRRIDDIVYGGRCQPCQCHQHAEKCDPNTGKCINCKDHTTGDRCDQCLPGYYGDPMKGTPMDCKACACPSTDPRNNFATNCEWHPVILNEDNYHCLDCRTGHVGVHCELCGPGYYGDPLIPGGYCRPCECNGNIDLRDPFSCDSMSGRCLKCLNNADGDRCGVCKPGFYGTAVNGDCSACDCDGYGSTGLSCDRYTGQCQCKENFGGRKCDLCQKGFGQMEEGCLPCDCDDQGSVGDQCDPYTGQCVCKTGVTGLQCKTCKEGFYGFSFRGCIDCKCDPDGTNQTYQCSMNTGYCNCLPNVIGSKCDSCQDNHWGLPLGGGCTPCDCSPVGSRYRQCDRRTGKCPCRPGIGGQKCDKCLPGYFGYSQYGCRRCQPCTKPGYICDPLTGECVCPPYTTGVQCERCASNNWDYNPVEGCKPCGCMSGSSVSQQCDLYTGKCRCKPDFTGDKCDSCLYGFYRYPQCLLCLCSAEGTDLSSCNNEGQCKCDDRTGQCQCKITFPDRSVFVDTRSTVIPRKYKFYNVIPTGDFIPAIMSNEPLYWSLAKEPLGDMTLSYNGYLSYTVSSIQPTGSTSPKIVVVGNGFHLVHTGTTGQTHRVKLHESYWKVLGFEGTASRKLIMVVLQNVTDILLLAKHDRYSQSLSLSSVRLDIAVPANGISSGKAAQGIESCQCPTKYSGLSCQDPSEGYYRIRFNITGEISDPLVVIGGVEPCDCHGHALTCDKETGLCQNCEHDTVGRFCEFCAPGYYGDATRGTSSDCQPCACPHINNNFSPSCEVAGGQLVCTNCSDGYVGRRCESCADGYYGNPRSLDGSCKPCSCNLEGSVSSRCDTCDEGCTRDLMAELDRLEKNISTVNITGIIPAPWNRLLKIHNETKELRELLDRMEFAEILDLENRTKEVQDMADKLMPKSMRALTKAENIETDANILKKNGTALADSIENMLQDLKDELGKLEDIVKNLYHNESGLNITAALEEAKEIMREIEQRNFTKKISEAFNESMLAEKLSEEILKMKYKLINGTEEVKKKLDNIISRLLDLQEQSQKSKDKSQEADTINYNLAYDLKQLQDTIYDIEIYGDRTTVALGKGHTLNIMSWAALNQTRNNIKNLEREASRLDIALPRLRQRIEYYRDQLPKIENYTALAIKHAEMLLDQAEYLEKTFEKTKADAEIPLKAARVYSNIVKAVEEAEKAAKEALKAAEDAIQIAGVDDIKNEVEKSLRDSRRLLVRANELKNRTSSLGNHLNTLKGDVDKVDNTQTDIRNGLQDIRNGIDTLPKGISDRARRVTDGVALINDKVLSSQAKLNAVKDKIDNKLWPKYREIRDFSVDGYITDTKNSIDIARRNINGMEAIIDDVEAAQNRTKDAESNMIGKLKLLKDNIAQARAQAAKVKVSLLSGGKCARSYRAKYKQAATNNINFIFKTNQTSQDMLLVLVQKSTQEYLSVELIKGYFRFGWDVGDGPSMVDSPRKIIHQDDAVNEVDKWYKVEALRIQNIGILKVSPVKDMLNVEESRAASPGIKSTLKLDDTTQLFVSGTHINHIRPPMVTNGNFSGCISELHFDEARIGLHEFKTSSPLCGGCREAPTAAASATTFHFLGSGYASIPKIPNYNSREFQISFHFKTFWANSTLLFAGNEQLGDFYYLGLENGKLVLQIYTGGVTFCRLPLSENLEYNNNKWHFVVADRIDRQALLQVGEERITCEAPGNNNGLDILGSKFYFGGYPDSVDTTEFKKRGTIINTKFLGCLKDIQYQGSRNRVDLLQEEIVGVQAGCPDEGYRIIGFYGKGYAYYKAQSLLESQGGITLSFRTMRPNALLLLARDVDDRNYYTVALTDGKIEGRFSGNSIPQIITSLGTYNDGRTHTVGVLKKNRMITVYVDDVFIGEKTLPVGITTIEVTQLYLGGIGLPTSQDLAPNFEGLYGCMNDVVINGEILNLNTDVFENADVGRCSIPEPPEDNSQNLNRLTTPASPVTPAVTPKPVTRSAQVIPTTSSSKPGCAVQSDLAVDPFMLTFGNEEGDSYGEISNIAKNHINVRFNISFEFRTFHQEGVFFFIGNPSNINGDYVAAQIYRGYVMVMFKYDGDIYSVNSTIKTADGDWHSVQVLKGTKNVKLQVDKNTKRIPIKRKLNINAPVFVGGVSEELRQRPELVQHSLRGCLKNYYINDQMILIKDAKIVKGVTKCYVNVEPGVYFTGSAYGIIDTSYRVGDRMVISFDFRTHKSEGLILSLSNGESGPALTVELYNGRIQFSVYNRDRYSVVSENSEFELCDKSWHSVEAEVAGDVIELIVDGNNPLYGVSSFKDTDIDTSAPLFIGGLISPTMKQEAALTTQGFEGCLRNFKINSAPVNFFNLVQSYDIHKTDCPV
ncbi:laminin, alpha 1/2 [Mytilus galloprovincialis]|uniref:Laminin, alpha 1/2 n=1 Tax=Mytilus galloprovincialis TaxID=29158 RepID=A0A8B6CWL8_MYTGA|nr:laminin, alpha 1/2 [Mytilus galloprovincialis]